MSKKITSLLVVLTVVLFTLPTQAQTTFKAQKAKAGSVQVLKGKKALKAADQQKAKAAIAFEVEKAQKAAEAAQAEALAAAPQATLEQRVNIADGFTPAQWYQNATKWANPQSAILKGAGIQSAQGKPFHATHKVNPLEGRSLAEKIAGPKKAATEDEHGIITAPDEGETKYYSRAGMAYYLSSNQVYYTEQSGTVQIVEAADGTVYIKDIISRRTDGTWVKGTKEGNTITVAAGQHVAYNSNYSTTLSLYWGTYSEDGGWAKTTGDITFTVDEEANTISLNGSNENLFIGVYWDDDDTFTGFGDYETVWTLDEDYVPPSTELVELPAGATVENWYADGTGSKAVPTDAKVAFVGSDVYISGIFSDFPDSWIKGTLEGTTVTFESAQYLGKYNGSNDIWAIGADEGGNLTDTFTFTYDEEAKTLTFDGGYLLVNAKTDAMYYLAYITALTIYAEAPAPTQIDVLPYANDFSTPELQKHFSVIDANGDGTTWTYVTGGYYRISFATAANDDWFVSPAIKLVAGKKYHFAIDSWAQSTSYPETFEVRAATEATAEALAAGAVVLAEQDIASTVSATYENNEFTVDADGYYHIGIHNISNNMYYQYIDNFLIEAVPLTAPVTLDLTQEGAIDDFAVIDNNNDDKTWKWSSSNGIYYSYSTANAADDYLILPIKLEAAKNYNVFVEAAAAGASYPEKFEVLVGKAATVADLSTTVISEQTVATTAFTEYEGSFSTEEEGTYYIAVHATSDADQFYLKLKTLTVEAGADSNAPAAVTDLTAVQTPDQLEVTVSFVAPSSTIAGDALASISNIDVLRDGNVIKSIGTPEPGDMLTVVDNEGLTLGTHKYQVIPYNENGIGQKSEEVSVQISASLNVPYTFDLTQNLLDQFTVIDNNDDGSTWGWNASNGTYYRYNSDNDGDDYLITAPFNLVAGKNYVVTVAANSYSANWPEKFEVLVGKTPTVEGLTQTVIAETEIASGESTEFEGDLSVDEDGKYYIAIHATSDADQFYLKVQKLAVDAGPEPTAPAAPEIEVAAGAEGDLSATIKVTAPTTSIDGNALTENIDIDVLRDGVVIGTKTNVAPGALVRIFDEPVPAGIYTYQAIPSNASGVGKKSEKVKIFIGVDAPNDVENVVATPTASTIGFTWDAATAANGGYINPANVQYDLYSLALEQGFFGYYLVEDEILSTVTGETATTINYDTNTGDQEYKYFGVKATVGENASDATASYTWVLVGAPDELPIEEGFAGNSLHYNWDTNGGLGISTDDSDGDGTALKLYNNGTSSYVYFYLPKVNLAPAANPTLLFDVRSEAVNQVYAIGAADGAELDIIGNAYAVSKDYTTVKVPLNSVRGQDYSQVGLMAVLPTVSETQYEDTIIIDNIKIVDLYQYDLSAAVSAPKNVKAGEKAAIKATVKNVGENAATGYTITIKAGENVILEKTVNEELAPFAAKEFTADFETSIFDDAADVTITAEVDYANDLNPDNNVAETVISIKESTAAQPENVIGEDKGDEGVLLSWTAPSASTATATEDFAAYENGADEDGELGDWTLINANGKPKGGIFQDTSLASDGLVRAWQVFNLATYGGDNSVFAGPDGEVDNNYLISVYNLEEGGYPGNDDWLISPELPGIAQTLTLDVKAFNDYGAQTYQVLYSTTGKETADFELIEEVVDNAGTWNNVSYNLPEGTKYFAIRNITGGDEGFILAVDNITYLVGGSDATGFNIYYNGELIATVEGDVTTFLVDPTTIQAGEQTFAVSALYANGQESKPVEVTVNVTTAIQNIVVSDSKPADVYTLDGKLVRQQAKSLDGLKGVFVVNGKAVIVK